MFRGVAVAVLVVLAGCSGFAGTPSDGSPTDTLTPVPVPETTAGTPARATTPRPTTGSNARELVPGVTAERLVDPFALVNAHVVGIRAASYRVRRTTTVRFPNGTVRTSERTTARVGAGGERYWLSNEVTGPEAATVQSPPGRFEIWTDGERFLSVLRPRDGSPEYSRIAPDRYLAQREYYSPPPSRGRLLALLSAFDIRPVERRPRLSTPTAARTAAGLHTAPATRTAAGTRTAASGTRTASVTQSHTAPASTVTPSADGTPRPVPVRGDSTTPSVDGTLVGYRLVGTSLTGPAALSSVGPGTEVRNASIELYVDTRGRIRRYTLSYTAVVAGERMRVTQRSRYEVGGVRVERPDWYGAALTATNATVTPGVETSPAVTPAGGTNATVTATSPTAPSGTTTADG